MAVTEKFIRLHKSLMALSHASGFIDRPRFNQLSQLLKACAEALEVSRVSVWRLDAGQQVIECELLYILSDDRYESGICLSREDFPLYFDALTQSRLIDAENAGADPRTAEFYQPYLKPLDIRSMLDAPIFAGGKLFGVLCLEQVGAERQWDMAEISYTAAVADTVSLLNEQQLWMAEREQLQFMEQFDLLTGLEKRANFNQRLEADLTRNPGIQRTRALILLGIDYFSHINDSLGHAAADSLLAEFSQYLQQLDLPQKSRLARVAGDMFAVWLPELGSTDQLEQMLAQLQGFAQLPLGDRGERANLSISTGVVVYNDSQDSVRSPMRCAEVALQRAKEQARGSIVYFSEQWLEQMAQRRTLEAEMLQAIEEEQFVPFYQPIICARSGQCVGLEALIRWQHPERGLVSPAAFLPLAKKLGLMCRIGSLMLQRACADLEKLRSAGTKPSWVSVNLAADQLYSSGLVQEIDQLLGQHQLPPGALELEIVEELISQDSALVRAQIHALSELGIRLVIDDFGTGYSSLARLKEMPVSKLKIDKSFIDGLPEVEHDRCISESIIGLAKGLRLQLVAEGVETQEQAEYLSAVGCDYLQGFYFARPMPFSALESFLALR